MMKKVTDLVFEQQQKSLALSINKNLDKLGNTLENKYKAVAIEKYRVYYRQLA